MQAIGTQLIQTERLVLRPFNPSDAQMMFEHWAGDEANLTYLGWHAHTSVEETLQTLEGWQAQYSNPLYFKWAITLDDQVIGDISVVRMYEDISAAEIGYVLSKNYWGKSIMSEALKAVIHYLFTQVELNRIASRHDINNPASGRVMQKAGMQYEGTLRQSARNNQGIVDEAYYSILRSDY